MSLKKPKRGSPALDMTAMVDVAFLLLTFFILTTTRFREDQSIQVDAPTSVSDKKSPEKSLTSVLVSDSGKVFIGFSDIKTRESVIKQAIENKDVEGLTEKEVKDFVALENFGVPMKEIKVWLSKSAEERKKFVQTGISAREQDTAAHSGNELKKWLFYARYADAAMQYSIKGDRNADYYTVSDVISTFQESKINHMGLITNLEGGDRGLAPSEANKEEKAAPKPETPPAGQP